MQILKKSLRGRLLSLFILVAVAPLTVATTLAVRNSRSTVERQVGAAQADMAQQVSRWLDRVVYERTLELQGASAAGELAAAALGMGDSAATRMSLAALKARSSLVRAVRLYDAQGTLVDASGDEERATAPIAGASAEWFQKGAPADAPTYVGPVVRDADQQPIVRLSQVVRTANGTNLGVLLVDLDWSAISDHALGKLEAAAHQRGNKTFRAYVIDPAGTIVASSSAADVLTKKLDNPTIVAAIAAGQVGSTVTPFLDGTNALVAYAPMASTEDPSGRYRGLMSGKAGIVVAEETHDAFSDAESLRNLLILVSLIVAVVVGLYAWHVSGRVAHPLVDAANLAERLAMGDTRHEIRAVDSEDETGRLNGALRRLLAYMREMTAASEKIAAGNMDLQLVARCEHDELSRACLTVAQVNANLIEELGRITRNASNGQLGERGRAEMFEGSYRALVEGVNHTLDAVVEPIHEASAVLERLAARDLTARVLGSYKGDHAKIKDALNSAAENLDRALSDVWAMAEQVASASGQIGAGSQALAEGANRQASSLEEVSSSLQELASRTRQNAVSAQEARKLAEEARGSAESGSTGMERLSTAMDQIKDSASATAKIVKTIDEIAFQTNLLALNAAVAAARAGDAGRGFAVVAEEVRNLALRSADAARTTADLIEQSVLRAEGGVAINGEVLRQLSDINHRVLQVREVMGEIAGASEEQSHSVEQINTSVDEMNMVTQHVAANSEESAATAEELSGQAQVLRRTLAAFTLTSGDTPAAARGRGGQGSDGRQGGQARGAAARATALPAPTRNGNRQHGGAQYAPRTPAAGAARVIPLDSDEDLLKGF